MPFRDDIYDTQTAILNWLKSKGHRIDDRDPGSDRSPDRVIIKDKRCIFCRSSDRLTDEHIWGDWTKTYVERASKKHAFQDIRIPKPGVHKLAENRLRAGDPLISKVRIVCAKCNSGWMSQIQERAKPFLVHLFKGQFHALNRRAQTAIAAWVAMATMTGEHLPRNPDSDRYAGS